ncbi:hypothetical protein ACHAWF_004902, partial [Thalassiosira exigua]
MEHYLVCPMQCQVSGIVINEIPRFLCSEQTEIDHCIVARHSDQPGTKVIMPLALDGVTSFLPVWKPSPKDFTSDEVPQIEMTSEGLDCGTHRTLLLKLKRMFRLTTRFVSLTSDFVDITHDDNFAATLESCVQISRLDIGCQTAGGKVASSQRKPIEPHTLARRWGISPGKARQTVKTTTQVGVRECLHPTTARRRSTNDRMFRYKRFGHDIFTDTMFAGTKSSRGNKCAQVYGTDFGWSRAFPMKSKGDAHETLSLLFKRDGVPPQMIMDCSKEQLLGRFARKCREANCYQRGVEPYSPWCNAAEGTIRETKRGSSRKMISSGSPKCLWDHCLELEALVRSHTALDIFRLNGEVPETLMTGQTADISHISEFSWYDWVYAYDELQKYPGTGWELARYLGPSPDIGSHFTMKILKSNGEVIHRSTVRSLTEGERVDPEEVKRREAFTAKITQKLGRACEASDVDPKDLTPDH